MSGLAKKVKKVFKRVADVARVVAPVALTAAAVYFTAGAGAPLLGGVQQALGGGVLSSVVTNAAVGAGVGGLGAALTGGNVAQGALLGAGTGGLVGGLMGPVAPAQPAATGQPRDLLAGSSGQDQLGGGTIFGGNGSSAQAGGGLLRSSAAPAGSGQLGAGNFLADSRLLSGNLILGLGQGLLQDDPAEGALKLQRAQRKTIQGNYGQGLTPGYTVVADADAPGARDPGLLGATWEFDRQQGRIVRRSGGS